MDRAPDLKLVEPAGLRKLLAASREFPCAWCHRAAPSEAAHCNELALGRGFAHKTADFMVAYLCRDCHDQVDGRAGGLEREVKRAMWCRAYAQTVKWWFEKGLVQVK